jgi:hypothetical protein
VQHLGEEAQQHLVRPSAQLETRIVKDPVVIPVIVESMSVNLSGRIRVAAVGAGELAGNAQEIERARR